VVFLEITNFTDLAKFANFAKLIKLTEKFELTEKETPAPWPTPIYKLSVRSMAWSISPGQLGLPAPSPLLHTCLLAECGRLEKVLHFLATIKTSVYYQRSSRTKYKTQQLLGGKLTLIHLKRGQCEYSQ